MVTFSLLFAGWTVPAWAGSLSGQVRADPEGDALEGITVVAWDARLSYHATVTEADGSYLLSDLEAGSWRVQALVPDEINRVERYYPDAETYCEGAPIVLGADEDLGEIDLALPTGAALVGRILDADGNPVVGAEIQAEGADELVEGLEREANTDADGNFALRGLGGDGGSSWRCRVRIEGIPTQYLGGSYGDEEAEIFGAWPGEEEDLGAFSLLPGIAVEGTITGPEGPVADASVHVYATSQVVSVETDSDGTYSASGIPPGDVLAWAGADGLATTYYPDVDRPGESVPAPNEGDLLTGVDLTLPTEAVFRAQLLGSGEADEDLSGVTALLYNDTQTVGFGARVSEDGALAIDGLHGGTYTLYIFAGDEGYADDFVRGDDDEPTAYTVLAETDNEALTITLPLRGRLSGTLSDETGAPVYGATVVARLADDPDASAHAASSDRAGAYVLDSLPAGRWTLEARYGAYCTTDAGYVSVWYPDSVVNEAYAGSLTLADAERIEDLDLVLPRDAEQDGMGDSWESDYDLDPTRDDSAEDPDGDGYSNLDEFLLGTDPTEDSEDKVGSCRCATGGRGGAGWLALGMLALLRRRRP